MNKKIFLETFLSALIVVGFFGVVFYLTNKQNEIPRMPSLPSTSEVTTGDETKINTEIGRPEVPRDYSKDINFRILNGNDWKLIVNNTDGYYFQYPSKSFSEYIYTGQGVWPPTVKIEKGDFKCDTEVSPDWPSYCVTKTSEGAMGRNYVTYNYKYKEGADIVSLKFTIVYVNCGVFDEPKKRECEQENKDFRVDGIVSQIESTLVLIEVNNFKPALVAGFKTYTSDKYKFQVDIPEDWTLEKIGNIYGGISYDNNFSFRSLIAMSSLGFQPGPIYTAIVNVGSASNTIYNHMKKEPEMTEFIKDLKEVTLGGKVFTSYINDGTQCTTYNLEIEHSGRLYSFDACTDLDSNKDLKEMAASLGFTN